jgi:hypothetical protein
LPSGRERGCGEIKTICLLEHLLLGVNAEVSGWEKSDERAMLLAAGLV